MDSLTDTDKAFLAKRAKRIKLLPFASAALGVFVLVLAVWMLVAKPLMVNPAHSMKHLDAGEIPIETVHLMASILPFVMVAALAAGIITAGFIFLAASNERKYQALVNRLSGTGI